MSEKILGIIGGMGPEATADLYLKIIRNTPANCDQEHMHILIDGNAKIPDRVQAIFEGGEDPSPILAAMAHRLFEGGADYLAIACNTAHFFYDSIQSAVPIPVLHMPKLTIDFIRVRYPQVKKIGILATNATIRTGLYQNIADDFGLETLALANPYQQNLVQNSIHLIKAGKKTEAAKAIRQAAEMLIQQGAEVIIAGCTEIPLVLEDGMISIPVIDPTLVLAKEIVATRAGEGVFS